MPVFIWSPHHEVGKNIVEKTGKIGFRFESRDELDYRILNTLNLVLGYDIDHTCAHTVVSNCSSTTQQLSLIDLNNDKENLLTEMFKHQGLASFVRCSTGTTPQTHVRGWSLKNHAKIFTGIVGYTNHQSTSGINSNAKTPDKPNQPRTAVATTNRLLELAERFPTWKEI